MEIDTKKSIQVIPGESPNSGRILEVNHTIYNVREGEFAIPVWTNPQLHGVRFNSPWQLQRWNAHQRNIYRANWRDTQRLLELAENDTRTLATVLEEPLKRMDDYGPVNSIHVLYGYLSNPELDIHSDVEMSSMQYEGQMCHLGTIIIQKEHGPYGRSFCNPGTLKHIQTILTTPIEPANINRGIWMEVDRMVQEHVSDPNALNCGFMLITEGAARYETTDAPTVSPMCSEYKSRSLLCE